MQKPLHIIQSSTNIQRIEQAIDATLVAAIFDNAPQLLIFIDEPVFNSYTKRTGLDQKIAQLKELNVGFNFANAMTKINIRACLVHANHILSY